MNKGLLALILAISFFSVSIASAKSIGRSSRNNRTTNYVVNDAPAERSFDMNRFTGVSVSSGIEVIYTVSSKVGVRVKATTSKLLERVIVENVNGSLTFRLRNKNGNNGLGNGKRVVAYVSGPSLSSVRVSSGGDFTTKSSMTVSSDLYLEASSGGEISLASVSSGKLSVQASSGAEINVDSAKGTAVSVSTTSGAEIEINNISCQSIASSGSSGSEISITNATVRGTTSFNGSSGAEFKIAGSGNHVDFNVSSGAQVKARRFAAKTGVAVASRSGGDIECNVAQLDQPQSRIKNVRRN